MAWIELHQTLPTHRKIKKLKRLLKIKTPQAVGHVVMLWLWSIDNAPDGDLSPADAEDIAEAAEWTGNAEKFASALVEAGFIDDDLHLHDWGEYAGRLMDQREERRKKERDRKAQYRAKKRAEKEDTPDAGPPDGQDSPALVPWDSPAESGTVPPLPNLTVPDHTKPDISTPRTQAPAGAKTGPDAEPEETSEETPLSEAMQAVRAVVSGEAGPQANPELGRVMSFYMNRVNATPSHSSIEELGAFAETMEADVIIQAMEYALDEHKAAWSYIRGTLRAYQAKGIRTMADLQRANDEFEKSKKRREDTHNASTRRNAQGRGPGGAPPAGGDPLRGFHTEE